MISGTFQVGVRSFGRIVDMLPDWVFDRKTHMLLDGLAAATALFVALLVRFEFDLPRAAMYFAWLPVVTILRPHVLCWLNSYRKTWRHFHLSDGLNLAGSSVVLTVILVAFRCFHSFGMKIPALPLSVVLSEVLFFISIAGFLRIMRRLTYSALHSAERPIHRALLVSDNVSVGGAVRLVEPYHDVQVVGIITKDSGMHGRTIAGIPVLGDVACLQQAIVSWQVDWIMMTSSGVSAAEEIVAKATEFGVQVRIVPTARDLVGDRVRVSHSLQIDQVVNKFHQLNPEPHPDVISCLNHRCVLVTGAGGSIGSEISRQVAFLPVSKLVVLDQDENSIFLLMNELKATGTQVVPVVGDIRDSGMVQRLFAEHRPDIVLHAAAYKHVPVMEHNPTEAILNNVTGTRQLVEAAEKFDCERFVMISTDKAVHPSSVMGATKRTAELLVQHRALFSGRPSKTQFACVRFGNVLGSRGSVVPIFLRQIAAGGPVTITHEEMTRYFMTIPQAVQLVLQAATLASTGDIYMLEMGDPVKIIEFARDLIRMSGLRPDIDIPISVTGTRPGEKLHEQLWYENSEVVATSFTSVLRVKSRPVPQDISTEISRLERAAATRAEDEHILDLLTSLPIGYTGKHRVAYPSPARDRSDLHSELDQVIMPRTVEAFGD
jgi:FlaA1/EpsC-like NDP-sugar epimerase